MDKIITSGLMLATLILGYGIGVNDFVEPVRSIAYEKYDIQDNNCYDKAEKLVSAFEEQGYEAEIKTGWKSEGFYLEHVNSVKTNEIKDLTGHAWVEVCIPVEATTGKVIDGNKVVEL